MAEVTFANFDLTNPNTTISDIGADTDGVGVAQRIADAFNHQLPEQPSVDDLGNLIGASAPNKYLQDNVALAESTEGGIEALTPHAIEWVDRSGLLVPVRRPFMKPETVATRSEFPEKFDTALITGGVRNWMRRRANQLLAEDVKVRRVLLAASGSGGDLVQGEDIEGEMTQAEYMEGVLMPELKERFDQVSLVRVGERSDDAQISGERVMAEAASMVGMLASQKILVVSNAGAWPQNAGQFRRAAQAEDDRFDATRRQLFVVTDEFSLARHGESPSEGQSPVSALGMITRNLQEFERHQIVRTSSEYPLGVEPE